MTARFTRALRSLSSGSWQWMVSLTLFGGASIARDGRLLDGPATQRHRLAFLALLAASHPRAVARDRLIALLWPERDTDHARNLLSQAVHAVRRALAEYVIVSSGDELRLNPEAVTCDVLVFGAAVAAGERERAVTCYGGPFLHGFHVPDAPEFEQWADVERERLSRLHLMALEQLAEAATLRNDAGGAVHWWRQAVAHDPCNARLTVRLMESLDAAGDRAGAIQQARRHSRLLRQEFDADPDAEVAGLAERLRRRSSANAGDRTAGARSPNGRPFTEQRQRATALDARSASWSRYPLVGRGAEWERLRAAWEGTHRGPSRLVVITGEAGIGKTRLAEEMVEWAAGRGIASARTRCFAAEGRLAYAPVADWLRSPAVRPGLQDLDTAWLTEAVRLLPELRDERPDIPAPEALTEGWQRQRLFAGLAHALLAHTRSLVLLIDDLQWCDQDTLHWLHYLLRFDTTVELLVVGTARSEEISPEHPLSALLLGLRSQGQLAEIPLGPLNAGDTAILGSQVAEQEIGAAAAAQLFRESEGSPLFVVESIRARGLNADETVVAVPPRVQAVIEWRLSQLSPAAQVLARVAATLGRDFTLDVLTRACDSQDASLIESLDELWKRRIVREHGTGRFDFSHDRLREVAYATIGPMQRRTFHRRAAEALEAVYAGDLDAVVAQIAAHYDRSEQAELAIDHYERAAEVASRVYANDEALAHLTRALTLLSALPESPARDRRELSLQIALGALMRGVRGWSAPETGAILQRARELSERLDGKPDVRVLVGLHSFQFVGGRALGDALDTSEQAIRAADAEGDPVFYTPAHGKLGEVLCQIGEFEKAQEHLDCAIRHYDRAHHRTHTRLFGVDKGMFAFAFSAHTLWHLGYPDRAVTASRQALALGAELGHPFSRVISLGYDAMLHQFRADAKEVEARAAATMALSGDAFPYYRAWGRILHGWALTERGEVTGGIADMREGLAAMRATGADLRRPYYLALLAEVLGKSGQVDEALSLIEEGLRFSASSREHWRDAELHRLAGELLLARSAPDRDAETRFHQALAIARGQKARMLELRAAVSLGRLLQRRGECEDAREIIAKVYGWFTEGSDSRDVTQARALLAELT